MMKQLFVCDLETTGTSFSDACLELAFLQLIKERGFYRPGRYYRRVFHYSFSPESLFARNNHASLYDECRYADTAIPTEIAESIRQYFADCNATDAKQRVMIGSRLSFKLEVLDRNNYLSKPQLVEFASGPVQVGDYYSIIDLYAVGGFVAEMFAEARHKVEKRFADLNLEAIAPLGQRHRALYDCFHYLNKMNQYRLFFLSPWEYGHEGFFESGCQI